MFFVRSKEHVYQLNTYEEDQKILHEVFKEISEHIGIKKIRDSEQPKIGKQLSRYNSFKEYPLVALFDAYAIQHSHPFELLVVTTNSTIDRIVSKHQINRETIVEHEYVGLARLKKNYGHTFIRPETITDKINELFNPVEVDFESAKSFNNKYYVLTDNEQNLRNQITTNFLNTISKYDGLEIEIINKTLILRTRSRISLKSATKVVNCMARISDGKN